MRPKPLGQSMLEYGLVLTIITLAIMTGGPYLIGSVKAHFTLIDRSFDDSGPRHTIIQPENHPINWQNLPPWFDEEPALSPEEEAWMRDYGCIPQDPEKLANTELAAACQALCLEPETPPEDEIPAPPEEEEAETPNDTGSDPEDVPDAGEECEPHLINENCPRRPENRDPVEDPDYRVLCFQDMTS